MPVSLETALVLNFGPVGLDASDLSEVLLFMLFIISRQSVTVAISMQAYSAKSRLVLLDQEERLQKGLFNLCSLFHGEI